MTSLSSVINHPYKDIETYRSLHAVLQRATVKRSWLGGRYLQVPDLQGCYSLDHLFERIYQLAYQDKGYRYGDAPAHSQQERLVGRDIVALVNTFIRRQLIHPLEPTLGLCGILLIAASFCRKDMGRLYPKSIGIALIALACTTVFLGNLEVNTRGVGMMFTPTGNWMEKTNLTEYNNTIFANPERRRKPLKFRYK